MKIKKEVWRTINGFDLYQVSNYGRIKFLGNKYDIKQNHISRIVNNKIWRI